MAVRIHGQSGMRNSSDKLVATWLQLMWMLPPDRFERAIDDLVENAEKFETSMINCVQAFYPLDPGPCVSGDG